MRVLAAAALFLSSCAQCAADCQGGLTVHLAAARPTATAYDFDIDYDGVKSHSTCRFDLTGEPCEGYGARVHFEDGVGFVVSTTAEPRAIRIVVKWSGGADTLDIAPSYSNHTVCGATCASAEEWRTLER